MILGAESRDLNEVLSDGAEFSFKGNAWEVWKGKIGNINFLNAFDHKSCAIISKYLYNLENGS